MILQSIRLKIALFLASLLLASCGGGGSSAAPPTDFLATAGDGQVTLTWTATSGVDYWIAYAQANTVSADSGTHYWVSQAGTHTTNLTSPLVLSGLTNGLPYAFSINGRTDGGSGGASTASQSVTPRPGGTTWAAGSAMGTSAMYGIAYGTATDTSIDFVAVGDAGAIYKGTDGKTWTQVTTGPGSSVNFRAATYTLAKFIAVGDAGAAYSSADLITWTAGTGTTAKNLNALASNGTTVVAVGDSGTILLSGDGVTWTTPTVAIPTSNKLRGVTYAANGVWLAVGDSGTVLTSTDANTWTLQTSNTTANLTAIATTVLTATPSYYTYVAVSDSGTAIVAIDNLGAAWTNPSAGPTSSLSAIVGSASQFLAVGAGGAAFTSPDGMTWTAQTTGATADLHGLYFVQATYVQAQYIAVGAANATQINNFNSH